MHQFGAGTSVGNVRDNNEDSYVCDQDKELWMVADGMGGLGFGEVASAITSYTVTRLIREGHGVNQAIELAHRKIKEYAESDAMGANMGTTIVLLLSQGSLYNIFWVGDSRAYLFDKGKLNQITVDHSLVQSLIEQGEITREEAASDPRKNAVTRALGVQELETVRADSVSDKWLPGQKVLLCSDGLTDCVSNDDIEAILGEDDTDQAKVDRMIETALENGGHDNITVVLISAPESARKPDSDTESPGGRTGNDDTQTPDNDTDPRENRTREWYRSPDNQYRQQAIQTDDTQESIPTLTNEISRPHSPKGEKNEDQSPWHKLLLASAAVISVAIFAHLNTSSSPQDTADFSPFPGDSGPTVPPTIDRSSQPVERQFPDIEQPDPGIQLQVGVFTGLDGAELKQRNLTQLGLEPWIRKRATDKGVLYVVLLGPYDDDQRRQSAMAKLDANNLEYFKRQPRDS